MMSETLTRTKNELQGLKDTSGWSWRKIALEPPYVGIPPGTLASIAKGYPVPEKYFKQLGIVKPAKVIPFNGEIEDGSQALGSRTCIAPGCQQPFVSNHGKRKKCYTHSPYRGKEKV